MLHNLQVAALSLTVGLVFSTVLSTPTAYASIYDVGNEEEWKTVYTVGKFSFTDSRKPDQIFKIQYRTVNGTIDNVSTKFGFSGNMNATDSGILEIKYPRNYPYTNSIPDEPNELFPPILLIDGRVVNPEVTPAEITDCFFVFSIPFSGSVEFESVELGWAYLATNLPFHGDEVPEHCIPETVVENVVVKNDGTISPYHQYEAGVRAQDVMCQGYLEPEEYRLVVHPDGRPFCATPNSVEVLKERWTRVGIAEAEKTTVRVDVGGVPKQERIQSGTGKSLMTTYLPVNITQTINLPRPVDRLVTYPMHVDWDGVIHGGEGRSIMVDENNNAIKFEGVGFAALHGVFATCTEPYFVEVKESDVGEDGIKLEQTTTPVTSRIYWGDTFHITFYKPQSGTISYTIGGYGIVPEDYNNETDSTYRNNGAGNQDVSGLYHLSFVSFYPATVTLPERAETTSFTEVACDINKESTYNSVSSFARIYVYDVWFRFE